MTDTSFSSASLRMQRGRNPSGPHAPSSRNFDDGSLRVPGGGGGGGGGVGGGNHSLRSVSSRFSLGEHFAATRSLYEFGFDDASSYAAPSVVVPGDGAGAEEQQQREREITELLDGDFYDTLCLPRAEAGLTKEDVRRAYHRMFLLFYPDMYPQGMQEIARRQFERAQEGFEVLVDEVRRRKYDGEQEEEEEEEEEEEKGDVCSLEEGSRSDVGVRIDASRGLNACRPLDFVVGHSSSVPLPCLSSLGLTTTSIPSLTLSSSIYGIVPPMSLLPMHILSSPHQPLHPPATSPRHRLLQLVESKVSPVVGARLVHSVANGSQGTAAKTWLGTRCESSLDILPALAPSVRLFHSLNLLPAAAATPPTTILETSIKSRSWWSSSDETSAPPRAALGVQHPLPAGTAFARVDTGDWDLTPEAYRFVTSSGVARATEVRYADFPLRVAPTVELGFTTAPETLESGPWRDAPAERAPSLLDGTHRPQTGSWTVSSVIQPLTSITTTLLYTSPPLPVLSSTNLQLSLSTSTVHPSTVCLRQLLPLGTANATCGLELSFSRFSTHVSLHISHSDRHFSLPLLFPTVEHLQPQTLFLAGAVPFLALAAYKFLSSKGRGRIVSKKRSKGRRALNDETLKSLDTSSPAVQAAIAHRREEADHLTGLLANPVATRQKHHASHGNLVILSAKFGLPALQDPSSMTATIAVNSGSSRSALPVPLPGMTFHPDEEIADVTVALAALVDDQTGGLRIPANVQKGCIPGFWDPAPGREKLLLVRYSWRGREDMIAVRGDEELILPPK